MLNILFEDQKKITSYADESVIYPLQTLQVQDTKC